MARRSNRPTDRPLAKVALLACLLVATIAWVPVADAAARDERPRGVWITGTNRSGDSVVRATNATAYVWYSERHSVTVDFHSQRKKTTYSVCLYGLSNGEKGAQIGCDVAERVANGSNASVTVKIPNRELANGSALVELRPAFADSGREPLDRRVLRYQVLKRTADPDGDGLSNEREVEEGLNFSNPDIDTDGLLDGREVTVYKTDPKSQDTDGDGRPDGAEIRDATDPTAPTTTSRSTPVSTTTGSGTTLPGQSDAIRRVAIVAGIVILGGLGAVLIWRRGGARPAGSSDPAASPPTSGPEPTRTSESPEGPRPQRPPTPSQSGSGDGGADDPSPPLSDDILLTDEDKIYELVSDNGGQMKQAKIVEAMDWSKSKVSRLLSKMERNGRVNKLRIGRGNVIYLDGSIPDAARSTHDEGANGDGRDDAEDE